MTEYEYRGLAVVTQGDSIMVRVKGLVRHDGGSNVDHEYAFTQRVADPQVRRELAQFIAGDNYRVVPVEEEPVHGSAAMDEAGEVIQELVTALVHTVEYVGMATLPAIEGWSWYDALSKCAPATLRWMLPSPEQVIIAHQRKDAGDCICDQFGVSHGDLGRSHALHVWEMLQRHGVTGPPVKPPRTTSMSDEVQTPDGDE